MSADREGSVSASGSLKGVAAKKGMLSFTSLEAFEKAYPEILNMNAEQSAAWEKSLGFVSQRNIFNQIVQAEYEYLEKPYENKSEKELKRITAPQGHTDLYRKYLRAGVIKIQPVEQGEDTYDYALSDRSYTPIVNADGFFMIGTTIYQVKDGVVKEMKGGDLSKLSLLAKAKAGDSANKITVLPPVDASAVAAARAGLAGCSFPRSSGWITSGSRRGATTVNCSLSYWYPYPYKKVTIVHNVFVQSQKKNVWGTWIYPPCPNECWISGTWTTNFDYMSASGLGYAYTAYYARSYSYPHPNCINNFQASVNPTTGVTAPYPSSFVYTAPAGLAFLGVRISPLNWSVSVPGGPSGISCGVSC